MSRTATKEIQKKELSASERFTQMILKEFANVSGNGIELSPAKKQLAQHLFIALDKTLQELELKRQQKGQKDKAPIIWANVNLPKLAKDAIHRINLGLDAYIDNHISFIPYFNSSEKKYDIDLRIGYVGKDYYRRKMAIDPPKDIIYELVYQNDTFKPIKKDINHQIESFAFDISDNCFDRGEIIGGFGYIIYEDPTKNKLVLVSEKDFQNAEKCSKNNVFWKDNPVQMRYKTIVHRITAKLSPDPEKINESYMIVENDDQEERILLEIEEKANKEPINSLPETQETKSKDNEPDNNETDNQCLNETTTDTSQMKDEDEGPGF